MFLSEKQTPEIVDESGFQTVRVRHQGENVLNMFNKNPTSNFHIHHKT